MGREAFTYTNRLGRTFHLCAVNSRHGGRRLVMASSPLGEPLPALPAGWEVAESVNGTVSVRRAGNLRVTPQEIEQVRAALSAVPRLRAYRVDARGQEIVVHEPQTPNPKDEVQRTASEMGVAPAALQRTLDARPRRYGPVLRFVLSDAQARLFTAHRWCWRGSVDGWLGLGDQSRLDELLTKYLPHLGRDSFYELSGYPIKPSAR